MTLCEVDREVHVLALSQPKGRLQTCKLWACFLWSRYNNQRAMPKAWPIIHFASEILDPLGVFPLNPTVNESCNIECHDNKFLQIFANMIVSNSLLLKQISDSDSQVRLTIFVFCLCSFPSGHCTILSGRIDDLFLSFSCREIQSMQFFHYMLRNLTTGAQGTASAAFNYVETAAILRLVVLNSLA